MLRTLDTMHLGRPEMICAGLVGGDSLTLIDCGPEAVFDESVAAIRRLGLRPERVSHVLITHIHLDHSGAAWRWATEFGSTIWAHPAGARHLIDPGKLVASAIRVFGANLQQLWGRVQPVPERLLCLVGDGEQIETPAGRFRAVETPGHALHHNAYWQEESKTLFAGDVAGVIVAGRACLPPCPPPDINLESWRSSLAKIRALRPKEIFVTHGGILKNAGSCLVEMERRLEEWAIWVRDQLRAGRSEEEMVPEFVQGVKDELRSAGVTMLEIEVYEQVGPVASNVYGLARYWRKLHPEVLK